MAETESTTERIHIDSLRRLAEMQGVDFEELWHHGASGLPSARDFIHAEGSPCDLIGCPDCTA